MKKLVVFIILLVLTFIIFLYVFYRKVDYKLEYEIDDVKIKEEYNKDLEYYQIVLNYEDVKYSIISYDKYTSKRKLIENIDITIDDNRVCLNTQSKYIKTYIVCSEDDELLSNYYNQSIETNKKDTYKNIDIFDLDNKKYLLWDYHDFLLIDNKRKESIKLFSKDIYNLKLIYTYDNYLLVPDYSEQYDFNKLYIIDVNKGKLKSVSLRYNIYFDSYFLGNKKDVVYLYDKKQEQEYYINIKKEKIYRTDNKILDNNEWVRVSTNDLKNNEVTFNEENVYNYKVINNKLYSYLFDDEYLTKLSDMDIKVIVKKDKLDIYFISGNILYKYNPFDGFKSLISYSEWDFNFNNMAFVFD